MINFNTWGITALCIRTKTDKAPMTRRPNPHKSGFWFISPSALTHSSQIHRTCRVYLSLTIFDGTGTVLNPLTGGLWLTVFYDKVLFAPMTVNETILGALVPYHLYCFITLCDIPYMRVFTCSAYHLLNSPTCWVGYDKLCKFQLRFALLKRGQWE